MSKLQIAKLTGSINEWVSVDESINIPCILLSGQYYKPKDVFSQIQYLEAKNENAAYLLVTLPGKNAAPEERQACLEWLSGISEFNPESEVFSYNEAVDLCKV